MKQNYFTLKQSRQINKIYNEVQSYMPFEEATFPAFISKIIPFVREYSHYTENRKVDERDLTLTFTLKGDSPSDYAAKYKSFLNEITKGEFTIKIPPLGEDVYHLYYIRSASFGFNPSRIFSKISVKLNEPNPANRI